MPCALLSSLPMRISMKWFGLGALVATMALGPACKPDAPPPPAVQPQPVSATSVTAAPTASTSAAPHVDTHLAAPWFDGSIDAAFARAKQDGTPIFLYWGAIWCPPCNEIKAQVFNKPNFPELVKGFIPVYLDGDTPDAQRLGETFAISGYPTIVILSPEKEELLRLGGSLDAEEIEHALVTVRARGQTFRAALEHVEAKKPTDADCNLLAYAAWELLPEDTWPQTKIMTAVRAAVEVCPEKLQRERALLTSTLVGMASVGRKDPEVSKILEEIKGKLPGYLDIMFANADTAWAARAFVNNRASDVAEWLEGKTPTPLTTAWKSKWLDAAKWIRERKDVSVDTRLSSYVPMLEFEQHINGDKGISEATKTTIVAAVEKADADAKSPYDRHAVISGAAYLLRLVGQADKAKEMLLKEAEHTDTPYYYYSSLAAQEQALGHRDEARKWARKARESAGGRATRLQWITHDVQMNAKPEGSEERKYLLGLADEFYSLALTLNDGFLGRNKGRAKQIRKALDQLTGDDVKELLARHKTACEKLVGPRKEACQKHFE